MNKQPKDYPMGRSDQIFAAIKWAIIFAFGAAWILAFIKFVGEAMK